MGLASLSKAAVSFFWPSFMAIYQALVLGIEVMNLWEIKRKLEKVALACLIY